MSSLTDLAQEIVALNNSKRDIKERSKALVSLVVCSYCGICQPEGVVFKRARHHHIAQENAKKTIGLIIPFNIAAVLEFGLDKKPPVLDRPLAAYCRLTMVSPNSDYATDMLSGSMTSSHISQETKGMLQIETFETAKNISSWTNWVNMDLWKNMRAEKPLCRGITIVVVEFDVQDSCHTISLPIAIADFAIHLVRNRETARLDDGRLMPYTVTECVKVINQHIREDERNKFLLKKSMIYLPRESSVPGSKVEGQSENVDEASVDVGTLMWRDNRRRRVGNKGRPGSERPSSSISATATSPQEWSSADENLSSA
ncbi:hypothetical protein BDN70DRAFT_932373 [Pholiota conissans]|uniref:DUF8205 domain-containing protein n=1 Tax=Pholiota conissans TaxID=109636 RepID=A0A9P5Z2S0_9AGAR|nr:hypothetical protein BDN70DRAFT_932373 [Pholiota conissans]